MQAGGDERPGREQPAQPEAPGATVRGPALAITVVVATFNSAEHILLCIASARRLLPGCEVIVVDNGSSDDTCGVVTAVEPPVVLVSGHGNVGFGQACNLGVAAASRSHVLLLNPDAELVSADLEALSALTDREPFGMVSGMLSDGGPPHPMILTRRDSWVSEFVSVHVLAMLSKLAARPRWVRQAAGGGLYTASGALVLLSVEEFRSVGGFDERFFMYYEDTDLTQRYRISGHSLISTPALVARHAGGASAPAPRRNALSFLGWLEYTAKWHGQTAATRAAATARAVYSLLTALLGGLALVVPGGRLRAKRDQVAEMMSEIASAGAAVGAGESQARYPVAGPLATHAFRRYARGRR